MGNKLTLFLTTLSLSSSLIAYPFSVYAEAEIKVSVLSGIEKKVLDCIEGMKTKMSSNPSLQQDAETSILGESLPKEARDQYENILEQGYKKSCLLKQEKEGEDGFVFGIAYKTRDKTLEIGGIVLFPTPQGAESRFFIYDRKNDKEFRKCLYVPLNSSEQKTFGHLEFLVPEKSLQEYADALKFLKGLKVK